MRYEDASQSGLSQSAVDAHNDADHLAARDYGPATGNVITGVGTITGSTGADSVAPGEGHITAIEGAGGSDTSFSGGRLSVHGQYGTLSIDARGNYSYVRDAGSPAGVSDTFHYTLANNSGASDVARLVINIGDLPKVATEGTRVVPGADGIVTLPPGVELSDVHVVGRDLVVTLPDGSTMIIVDGAIFVPQLVLGGVEVPATNLAALLIDAEPHPAAGGDFSVAQQQSSGGNFEVPVAPLDPGVPLGDLLPPTELTYTPPDFHEIGQVIRNDPPLIGTSSVNVSEEGLPNGIPDTVGTPDTTNSPTANGVISVSDPNGDPITVAMGSPAGSLSSGGVAITWTVSPDGHLLTGSAGTNPVVTISVNNAGAYTVTLVGPVDHPAGGGEQGTDIVIPVSVSDGHAITTGGTITVTIEDDSPTIVGRFEEPTLVVDETVLATNDTKSFAGAFAVNYGADGPATSNPLAYALGVNAGATGLFDTATGNQVVLTLDSGVVTGRAGSGGPIVFTVSVDSSGNVTLDQQRAVVHTISSNPDTSEGAGLSADNLITLSLVATDRDGDTASTTINIGANLTFLDDGPSIATTGASEPTLVVDETTLAVNDSASFAGLFTTAFGADGPATGGGIGYSLSVVAGASGLTDTATGQAVNLSLVGGVVEGRTAISGDLVFTVSVNAATGLVTLDQIRAVVHTVSSNPDNSEGTGLSADNLISLTATVTDKDGDTATASVGIGSNLTFKDDGPSLGTVQSQQTDNNPATAPAVGTLHLTPGADGAGSAVTITADVTGIKSGGFNLVTVQSGNVLTAYQDTNSDGIHQVGESTAVFTITVNPSAGTSGQYVFDLITPLSPTVTDTPIGGSSSFGAGPTQSQTLTDGGTTNLSVVSGYLTGVAFNEATWLSSGTASGLTLSSVNGSTAGWGVANNNFEGTNEFFNWDFGSGGLDTQGGVFTPPSGVSLPDISFAVYDFVNYSAADDISYVVHFTDNTFVSGHIPTSVFDGSSHNPATNWTFTAPAGKFIADIEMYTSGAAAGKVDLVSVGIQTSTLNVTIPATVTLTDGDGDPTSAGAFSIHVQTGLVPFTPAAPIVLDLNGDGVHFLSQDAGVHFNYGAGLVSTAWAAPDDGILVRDANHDGNISATEMVFGGNGQTDMEALHAQYGAQLDANDADFTQFAVWNDANSNGAVDANELHSLAEAGIVSIDLVSDGQSYTAANGDVVVAGTATFTKVDGSMGAAADAAFGTGSKTTMLEDRVAANSNNLVLAAAIAAAGIAASTPAAASGSVETAPVSHISNMVVSAEPVDTSILHLSTEAAMPALMGEVREAFAMPQIAAHTALAADMAAGATSDLMMGHAAMVSPTALLAGSETLATPIAMPMMASNVAMPSADAMMALGGLSHMQSAVTVDKIVAEALHGGGSGPDINALLNALPTQGNAGNAGTEFVASLGNVSVPSWDTGHGAAFTFAATNAITTEAMVLHHDAIQPVANG